MSVFGNYAHYYDLLYRDKDYAKEADYVDKLIKNHAPKAGTIIELGCGTGNHAVCLVKKGYILHGVDVSDTMLQKARTRLTVPPRGEASRFTCQKGDIRSVRVKKQFDAAISLFDVMSYQNENSDIMATLETAKFHLKKKGLLLFNCWYGPAVFSEKPSVRIKKAHGKGIEVVRIAEPEMLVNKNCVDVAYTLFVKNTETGSVHEIKERHRMRYFFLPEMRYFLIQAGFELLQTYAWMTARQPSDSSWCVCFLGRLQ
jgi:SAM-dependent methyltransferase